MNKLFVISFIVFGALLNYSEATTTTKTNKRSSLTTKLLSNARKSESAAIIVATVLIVAIVVGLILYFVLINNAKSTSNTNSTSSSTQWSFANYNASLYADSSCGLPSIKPNLANTRIINGYQATPHSWPWAISLGYIGSKGSAKHVCGGTLISSTFVLTAAHCVEQQTIYDLVGSTGSGLASMARVYVGISNINLDKTTANTFYVKRIISHPLYDPNSNNLVNDIALLELTQPINTSSYVSLICVNQYLDLSVSQPLYAVGWGQIDESYAIYPTYLMQVKFNVLNPSECSKWGIDSSKQICAGVKGTSTTQAKDTCGGDSGGPIMVQTSADSRWFIVGLVSYGDSPCDGLGVYTNIKAYYNWVTSYVNL